LLVKMHKYSTSVELKAFERYLCNQRKNFFRDLKNVLDR
jgi:hypothetical protein